MLGGSAAGWDRWWSRLCPQGDLEGNASCPAAVVAIYPVRFLWFPCCVFAGICLANLFPTRQPSAADPVSSWEPARSRPGEIICSGGEILKKPPQGRFFPHCLIHLYSKRISFHHELCTRSSFQYLHCSECMRMLTTDPQIHSHYLCKYWFYPFGYRLSSTCSTMTMT